MEPEQVSKLIEQGLACSHVQVTSDDNTHYEALVISEQFSGKRPVARHQMIYRCLGKLMGNEIHAMAIRAHTPAEWRDLEMTGKV